ncbi:PTS system mannose/fructose/sorbose family transporter subunit IID [Oceanidesulfovibrio marinus]|nr:PTS system mannose/fructose/sorbose family transporter subunit IID [Oceanidesulfovibrio marinus]
MSASAGDDRTLLGHARPLMSCFLRTYFVGAAFNTRGMQNVGLVFSMEPGLEVIYPDPAKRAVARQRYLSHYNTHYFWTPLLVGVFLSLEDKISKGLFPANVLESVKDTTVYTLSAIGDSVLTGSLLMFWSLTTALFLAAGAGWAALVWGLFWFVSLQLFKLSTFLMGYKEGLRLISRLRQWNLINWGRRLKVINALILVLLLYLLWPEGKSSWQWLAGAVALGLFAWLVSRRHVSREIMVLVLLAFWWCLPWLQESLGVAF